MMLEGKEKERRGKEKGKRVLGVPNEASTEKKRKKEEKTKERRKKTKEEKIKKSDENPQKTPFGTAAGHCGVPQVRKTQHAPPIIFGNKYDGLCPTNGARQLTKSEAPMKKPVT
jgi:hypothetical protein